MAVKTTVYQLDELKRALDAELITFDRGFRDYPGLRVQIL